MSIKAMLILYIFLEIVVNLLTFPWEYTPFSQKDGYQNSKDQIMHIKDLLQNGLSYMMKSSKCFSS